MSDEKNHPIVVLICILAVSGWIVMAGAALM